MGSGFPKSPEQRVANCAKDVLRNRARSRYISNLPEIAHDLRGKNVPLSGGTNIALFWVQLLRTRCCGTPRRSMMMSDNSRRSHAVDGVEGRSEKIRSDLESRGVEPELSIPISRRLSAIAPDLSPKEYAAVLDGLAAAYVDRAVAQVQGVGESGETQRLIEGFTGELRKLEEGLQILSAYVVRMGNRSASERAPTLH